MLLVSHFEAQAPALREFDWLNSESSRFRFITPPHDFVFFPLDTKNSIVSHWVVSNQHLLYPD